MDTNAKWNGLLGKYLKYSNPNCILFYCHFVLRLMRPHTYRLTDTRGVHDRALVAYDIVLIHQ